MVLIIGLTNVTSKYRNTRNIKASFKKLESPDGQRNSFPTIDDSFDDFYVDDKINGSQQTYLSDEDSQTVDKNSTFQNKSRQNRSNQLSGILENNVSSIFSETGGKHVLKFNNNSEQYSLNDSLNTLKTLTLGDSRAAQTSRKPSIFRTKVYNSTSPDLFNPTRKSMRKFVLTPPKLKSFAQTSWVAGGYWQVGVDTPTLSRSSSQSSGFGSTGSNFGPSREPSITKEIDKCSITSDTAPFFYPPRPNSVNSINSCCQHVAPIQYARCENFPYTQPLTVMPNSGFLLNSQSHFSPVHPESCTYYEHCLSLQNAAFSSSRIQSSQQLPNYQNPLNNATWLTILLGGSLIFNIVVFCTIILR